MNYFSFNPNFSLQLQQCPQTYPARSSYPPSLILNSKTASTQLSLSPSPIASSTIKTYPPSTQPLQSTLLPLSSPLLP